MGLLVTYKVSKGKISNKVIISSPYDALCTLKKNCVCVCVFSTLLLDHHGWKLNGGNLGIEIGTTTKGGGKKY